MVNIGSLRKEYKIKLLDVIIQAATIKYLEEKITKQEAIDKRTYCKSRFSYWASSIDCLSCFGYICSAFCNLKFW
jgi:hypothetical protein